MASGSYLPPPGPASVAASGRPRTSGVFSGLLLILFGALLLLHNYGHLSLRSVFGHWWPLIFIFWGATKLYERTLAQRQGRSAGWITPGEVFLVIGLMTVVGVVVAASRFPGIIKDIDFDTGDPYSFELDVTPQPISPKAHVAIHTGRGNITVRSADENELRITGSKLIRTFSESDANRRAEKVNLSIVKNGDSYEIRPTGFDLSASRVGVDLDVAVPKQAVLTVHTDNGDINISDMETDVSATTKKGDVEINDTTGNVDVSIEKGDVKVSDTKGDVKVSGHGSEV